MISQIVIAPSCGRIYVAEIKLIVKAICLYARSTWIIPTVTIMLAWLIANVLGCVTILVATDKLNCEVDLPFCDLNRDNTENATKIEVCVCVCLRLVPGDIGFQGFFSSSFNQYEDSWVLRTLFGKWHIAFVKKTHTHKTRSFHTWCTKPKFEFFEYPISTGYSSMHRRSPEFEMTSLISMI